MHWPEFEAANMIGAANVLDAFVNQVEALVRSNRLTAAQADALIGAAREIAAALRT